MRHVLSLLAVLVLPLAARAVTIETVLIGDPNNSFDIQPQGLFGRVTTSFRMAETEITNAQYAEFLNAVAASDPYSLWDSLMGFSVKGGISRSGTSGSYTYSVKPAVVGAGPGGSDYTYGDKPVVFVSFYDGLRFANWLHNGQGTGSTETGAYTLLGGMSTPTNADSITRNSGANWFLPSESEWYKAAYYDGSAGIYYDYPTGTDTVPNNNLPSMDSGNSANFLQDDPSADPDTTTGDLDYPYTSAGAYQQSESPYGTFDQGGSVWEWNETLISPGVRGRRGGAWNTESPSLSAANQGSFFASFQNDSTGFRVATVAESMMLPGDFNDDGKVDAADYVVWRKTGGSQPAYDEWKANFGQMASGGGSAQVSAIPEPTSFLLLVGGLAALGSAALRTRRSGR